MATKPKKTTSEIDPQLAKQPGPVTADDVQPPKPLEPDKPKPAAKPEITLSDSAHDALLAMRVLGATRVGTATPLKGLDAAELLGHGLVNVQARISDKFYYLNSKGIDFATQLAVKKTGA